EGGSQALVPLDDGRESALRSVGVEVTDELDRREGIVDGAPGLELIEEPEPLLRERDGAWARYLATGDRRERRRSGPLEALREEGPSLGGERRKLRLEVGRGPLGGGSRGRLGPNRRGRGITRGCTEGRVERGE